MQSLRLKEQLKDVQGIIVRGYVELLSACYVLLGVRDAAAARRWLGELDITHGDGKPGDRALNIAFTYRGLAALGAAGDVLGGFSEEFIGGMTAPDRQRVLGDVGTSAPERWEWGGPSTAAVEILLMLYAADDARLASFANELASGFAGGGVEQLGRRLETKLNIDKATESVKEHFGFHDAISQPFIEGLEKAAPEFLTVNTGEIILGYPNEYGKLTERPLIPPGRDPGRILSDDPGGSDARDFGLNGTYLVFRHLEQDPCGFWRFMEQATRDERGESSRDARIRLAAKMVGRWPSGAPLALAPDADRPELRANNAFLYYGDDPRGLRCPLGSHIRRTNPRDSLAPEPGSAKSIAVNKFHQILRRGRSYGEPVAPSMDPDAILAGDAAGERGIFFICLNANISRQFEFVQRSWANNPKFNGLYDDTDPLIGARDASGKGAAGVDGGTFTVPADPVRQRVRGLPQFVTVRGGGYFFLPGLSAIRYLASLSA